MISIWSFLLSLIILAASVAVVIYSVRNGNRVAIVLALDAALISALGLLLNATTRGELISTDLLVFCVLPFVFAAVAAAICRFWRPSVASAAV